MHVVYICIKQVFVYCGTNQSFLKDVPRISNGLISFFETFSYVLILCCLKMLTSSRHWAVSLRN
jgi:hypothetical protein